MKNFTRLKYAIFVIFIFILTATCKKQAGEWKGTIESEDGITVVMNPKEPMYVEDVFVMEEGLSIGESVGREEYMFSQVIDVGVDNEENIYVLDFLESHIRVFKNNGEYLKTIGRKGQGPGEIQRAINIHITPANEILINDRGARHLHFFTLDGEYIRSVYQGSLSRPLVDRQNNIVARQNIIGEAEVHFVLTKFDYELKELFEIFSYKHQINPDVYGVYPPQSFWGVRKDDSIVWGYADKYELQILDRNGQVVQKIIKDPNPVEITEEDKQEWVKFVFGERGVPPGVKVNWKKYHNAFQFLHTDDEGRIFVQTYEKIADGPGYYYDVFNPEGKYIAKIPLKTRPQVLKNTKLYTIEEDEEGYQKIKRYKVTWEY